MDDDGIVNLVGNFIIQCQNEKKVRYNTCGCARCKLRANDIETWLNPANLNLPPDQDNADENPDETINPPRALLCYNCLRKACGRRCPYCGTPYC